MVNQLLSKLDGIHALDNVLVIGLTNRKDMIDDAVLRPGRLEVHVEVSEGASEQEQRCWRGCIFFKCYHQCSCWREEGVFWDKRHHHIQALTHT